MTSTPPLEHPILQALSRRSFLKGLGGGAALLWTAASTGCGYFPAEEGEAYAPWNFPGGEERPEYIAVGAAILAANPHNTQPWLFRITPERIDLYADMSKSLGAMDGLHREMTIGLGCALENLVWAAAAAGRRAEVTLTPDDADPTWVASVALTPATPEPSALYEAIPRRHTNRGRYMNAAPPAELEGALRERVFEPEVHLTFLVEDTERAAFRSGTIDATKAIINDREMNHDSHVWYRHTKEELDRNRDGLTLDATGAGATLRALGKVVGRPTADEAGQHWLDATRDAHTTGSAFCLLSTPDRDSRREQLLCGRAYQRLHLWATTVGLAMHPLNQMAERQDREQLLGLEPRFTNLLHGLIGSDQMGAQMLFRVGYPWDDALTSPRRPIDWVTR